MRFYRNTINGTSPFVTTEIRWLWSVNTNSAESQIFQSSCTCSSTIFILSCQVSASVTKLRWNTCVINPVKRLFLWMDKSCYSLLLQALSVMSQRRPAVAYLLFTFVTRPVCDVAQTSDCGISFKALYVMSLRRPTVALLLKPFLRCRSDVRLWHFF